MKPQLDKRVISIICILTLMFLGSSRGYAQSQWPAGTTPTKLTIQATVVNQKTGVLKGFKTVSLTIYDGNKSVGLKKDYSGVAFSNGVFSLTFDVKDLLSQTEFMGLVDPKLMITVDGEKATVPLYSTPFSIQSRVAETALSVDASGISGSFASANILGALIVNGNTLVVSSNVNRVGIGTSLPSTSLDVNGVVNAKGYKVGGVDLESSFSWVAKNPNSPASQLYYDRGFVGIGLVTPSYMLDVAGTVNAKEFRINGLNLSSFLRAELAWQNGPGDDIYFDDGVLPNGGYVGIGTTDPQEKLDIRGGIRIGKSRELNPKSGTIQYVTDTATGKGAFWGFNGTEWLSLMGIQGSGTSGNISYWKDGQTLAGSPNLFWDVAKGYLGVGTNIPNARLTVRGDSATSPIFNVLSATNEPLFYVSPIGIGIGTSTPIQKLDVKGIVNAQGYRINGKPLEFALSSDSYWLLENDGRIFYDKGFVGIGTTAPSNMLELASATGNPAITFGVGGKRLFTMGIGADNPDAFIIGKGADLSVPVFTFKNQNIGVGLSNPRANLHVSGNSGVIVSGEFGVDTILTEQGKGSKFIWFPAKAVIRGGYVQRDEWDDSNLGLYSVAFGYGTIASGKASTVFGGYRNRAIGSYSAVMGGLFNQANADYSFAAGHEAVAQTPGSFVWADYTPTSNVSSFISSAPNQFLIRANGGVGIGTTLTAGAALTVVNPRAREYIFNSTGINGMPIMVVTTSGNMGIGVADPGAAQLAVSGSIAIGTTTPMALLTVMAPPANTANLLFISPANTPTAALLITASGNVGIGIANGNVFGPADINSLFVAGGIKASEFKVVDPNDPNATITIQPNPGSPWADPSKNGGNTFRSTGFVGIGTPSPNNLLELSNRNASGNIPVLTFDIDGSDKYSLGVVTPNGAPNSYLFSIAPGGGLLSAPAMIIATSSIGIGIGIAVPSATLQVSGNAIFSGNVAIGTSNISSFYNLNVGGALNTDELYIAGQKFVNKDTPWRSQDLNIYFTSGNVGIGTSVPMYKLDVAGTIRANTFIISDPIRIDGALYSKSLLLKNTTGNVYGKLFVDNSQLNFASPPDVNGMITTKTISSPLQKATDNVARSGRLAYFANDSTLGQSELYWNPSPPQLTVSGNFLVRRLLVENGMHVTQNVAFGGSTGVVVSANLSHDGNLAVVRGYTAQSVDVSIDKNWGNLTTATDVKGLDINMQTQGSTVLNYASVVGLKVDVSGVGVDATNGGRKYSAIFMGGNVGIGTTRPQAELEVVGTVSANYFNLTGGLNVPELVVNGGQANSSTLVAKTLIVSGKYLPRVGIGISNPEAGSSELAVNGVVSANILNISGGLTATTMDINSGGFVVNSVGNIGIGTSLPESQISIRKQITGLQSAEVISQRVNLVIDGGRPGSVFSLDQNLVGMDVRLSSQTGSQMDRTAKGMSVDLTGLKMASNSNATGLYVDVTGTTGTRYAGIFQGGYVGIGTSLPQAELHVSGNIRADNLLLAGTLAADSATFNSLVVVSGATLNGVVTVNRLFVQGNLTANSVVIQSSIVAPRASFSDFIATTVSINSSVRASDLVVLGKLTGNAAYFNAVGIGTAIPSTGLSVSGSVLLDNVTVQNQLTLAGATLNVNSGTLYSDSRYRRVGIGTIAPVTALHIMTGGTQAFDVSNTLTWNPLTIHNRSTSEGSAAGILFTTDSLVSANTGAGIVAIRSSPVVGNPGSHLAFVTDPEEDTNVQDSGKMLERMRITSAGDVGIGTTVPSARLHVVGNAVINGSIAASSVDVASITSLSGTLNVSSNSTIVFKGTVSANSDVRVGRGLYFDAIDLPSVSSPYGRLFVNKSNNGLYYLPPGGTAFNISSAYTGRSGRVPFFDESGNLSDIAPITWSTANNTLTVGTANQLTRFQLSATVNNSVAGGTYAMHQMTMRFGDRSSYSLSNTQFTGLDLLLTGQNPGSPTTFGRLGQGETAIGLRVDMTDLRTNQYLNDMGNVNGTKYAAVFMGGNVGVGTTRPDAALHVLQQSGSGGVPFRVDTQTRANALMVSAEGWVGINTAVPSATLTVIATDNSASGTVFEVANNGGTSLFRVKNDGKVGIGTSTPRSLLDVVGTVQATAGQFTDVRSNSLTIGANSAFVVSANGNIGIGTSQPSGSLHFYKAISPSSPEVSQSGPFVAQKLDLSLGSYQANTEFYFAKDVTMLDISLTSQSGSQLGSAEVAQRAGGVSINMASLTLGSTSTAVGLNVNVAGTTGTRYAGIFLGGNVGIGTSNPTVALSVSGDIKAGSLSIAGNVEALGVTASRLVITGGVSINGTVTVNRLVASVVSANSVIMMGTLQVATASFTTVNATGIARLARVGVNVNSPTFELEVSGNTLVSGNLTVNGTMTVSTINAGPTLTISGTGTVNVSATMNINDDLVLGKGTLYLSKVGTPNGGTPQGVVFVDTNGDLNFMKPSASTPINISSVFTGVPGRLAYFNGAGSLGSVANMSWDNANSQLTIGTANAMSGVQVVSTVAASSTGNIVGHSVEMGLSDRSGSGTSAKFVGMDLKIQSINPSDPNTFGALAEGETAIGLQVDVSKLSARQFVSGVGTTGYKYAAAFIGGNVGIGTTAPDAALHVVSPVGNTAFRVDAGSTLNALVVAANGRVGIGTLVPSASLTVVGNNALSTSYGLYVSNSNGLPNMVVANNGNVGIGTSNPTALLDVAGTVSANTIVAGGIVAATLNVGSNALVVSSNGYVGFGTATPDAGISLSKVLTAGSTAYVGQKLNVQVGEAVANTAYSFIQNLTGMDIKLSSTSGSFLGDSGVGTYNATGVSINMSSLVLASNAKATGVYVNVAGTTGTRYAGIFLGGNVGIGTSNPTVALSVSGDIRADRIILSKGIDAGSVTVNSLVVRTGATVNGTVTTSMLVADTVSANNLIVSGLLQIATASFSTVNVTRIGTFGRIGIGGIANPVNDLDVSGNVFVTGNVTVSGILKVTTINSYGATLGINASGGIFVTGSMTVSSDIVISNGSLLLRPTSSLTVDNSYGRLYTDLTGDLLYLRPGSAPAIPISKSLLGTPNAVAFFDSAGMLTSSADVYWDPVKRSMTVGTSNAITSFQVVSSLNISNVGTFNGQLVDMRIGDRTNSSFSGGSINGFYGVDIQMAGQNSGSPIGFGRLASGEKAVGLRVDMTKLAGRYSSVDSLPLDFQNFGVKYGATFLGGGVGIGTAQPEAALHVVSELSSDVVFRVDTFNNPYAVVVSGNGMVGVGQSLPTARLSVKGKGSTSAFLVVSSSDQVILTATTNSLGNIAVGIGTSVPQATLSVSANATDVPFRLDIAGKSYPSLVVSQNGSVGIGTPTPDAMLHVVGQGAVAPLRVGVPGREYGLVVDTKGYVGIGVSTPLSELHTDGIFMSGLPSSLPSFISSSATKATGLLAASSNYYTFVGNIDRDGSGINSVVAWSSNKFRFMNSEGTDVMVFATNNIGIGTSNPTAKLEIVSTNATNALLALRGTNGVSFVVTGDGKVGVGTSMPTQVLDVSGNARIVGSLWVDNQVSTNVVTVNEYILLSKTIAASSTGSAQASRLILNGDTNGDMVGLDIVLNANLNAALNNQRKYTVWNGAAAIGMSVDLTGVNVADPTGGGGGGYKYAGIFTGGFVGIGTTRPTVALQVEGTQTTAADGTKTADLFKAGTTNGSVTLRDFDNGRIGFVSKGTSGVEYTTLVMAPPEGADVGGRVGIGVTNPDKALVVNGDMRIGRLAAAGGAGTPTASLYFSGGLSVSGTSDSDNGIPMMIRRSNVKDKESQLQVVVGSANAATSKFVVGTDIGGAYKPVLTVQMDGKVGITDMLSQGTFLPRTTLHVMGGKQASGAYLANHVMAIENSAASNGDALAIQFNYSDSQALTTGHHFMTFYGADASGFIGAIQSNAGGTGVRFLSTGADYAEYLEKVDPKESIELGDIVGVVNGKVSKDTTGAQIVMARSYAATVAGNHPNVKLLDRYELIAFFGQVKVKVRGIVHAGDYLVASGLNDGSAVAVAQDAITAAQMGKIVGTAWESSTESTLKLIHTAVGFGFSSPTHFNESLTLTGLQDDLAAAKLDRRKMMDQVNQRLADQDKELDLLIKQLNQVKGK